MTAASVADLYAPDSRRSPLSLAREPLAMVPAAVLLAGLGGVLSGASPTGWWVSDAAWTAALAGGVSVLATRAAPWTWLVALLAGAVAGAPTAFAVAALAAGSVVVAVLGGALWDRQTGLAGAAAVGVAVQALLRLDDPHGGASSAVVAALALAPVCVSGWSALSVRSRRVTRRLLAGGLAVAVGVTVLAGVAAWRIRSEVDAAVTATRSGLEAGRAGDTDRAILELRAAREHFDVAASGLGSWLARPALAIPGIGSNLRAVSTAAEEGARLTATVANALDQIEVDHLWVEGGVDLTALASLERPLGDSRNTLVASVQALADARSVWLVPPLAERFDELTAEVGGALDQADRALDAVLVAPRLLGADRPQRYLVLFGTPSETREGGGIVANVAEVLADQGRLEFGFRARNLVLNSASTATGLTDPGSYPSRFVENEPWLYSQNWTGTPDFPTAARAVTELYPQMGGRPIDGVVYLDPFGLAALLELTGPVTIEGLDRPLTADTAARFLLVDQYTEFPQLDDRVDFLDGAAQAVFDAVVSGLEFSDLSALADALGPAIDDRHLMVVATDPGGARVLAASGIDGAFSAFEGGDQVAVVQANLGADKLDAYLHRTIAYEVTTDASAGTFQGILRVHLESSAPPGLPQHVVGLPTDGAALGANEVLLSVFTPADLVSATVDGIQWAVEHRAEYGLNRYLVPVEVQPGVAVTVEWRFVGALPADGYALRWMDQAMVNPDVVTVTIDGRRVG